MPIRRKNQVNSWHNYIFCLERGLGVGPNSPPFIPVSANRLLTAAHLALQSFPWSRLHSRKRHSNNEESMNFLPRNGRQNSLWYLKSTYIIINTIPKAHIKRLSRQKLTATRWQFWWANRPMFMPFPHGYTEPTSLINAPSLLGGAKLPGFLLPWNSLEANAYIPTCRQEGEKKPSSHFLSLSIKNGNI